MPEPNLELRVETNYLPSTGTYVCWGIVDGVVHEAFVVPRRPKKRNQWSGAASSLPKPQPDGGLTYG